MILLVEDDALTRYSLGRLLSLSGQKVMAAADGKQAVELLDRHPFDLVITDLGLPKLDGFELIRHIGQRWPKMPVLVVSADLKGAEILGGQVEFFPKPAEPNALISAVERLTPPPVRLRDHALIRNWPPLWNSFTHRETSTVRREIGILRGVRSGAASSQCFLLIEHQGEFFMGSLMFQDAEFSKQVVDLLQRHLGRSIQEIGDLDLSHTL